MNIVDVAQLVALEAHGGDRNKHDGEMYSLHLARVWMNVRDAGGGDVEQAVAWLHDCIEDTAMTYAGLQSKLWNEVRTVFGNSELLTNSTIKDVVTAVDVLTKVKGESNEDYYNRVKANPVARFVKLHGDIKDNFRRNHQIADEDTRLRMAKKYSLGVDILS